MSCQYHEVQLRRQITQESIDQSTTQRLKDKITSLESDLKKAKARLRPRKDVSP